MSKILLAVCCLSLCGCTPVALVFAGTAIEATFHIFDSATQLFLYEKTGTYPGEPQPKQ